MLVRNWMTTDPIVATPNHSVMEALKLMKDNNIRRVPVVEDGMLVGIVTERDLLQASPSSADSLNIWEMNHRLSEMKLRDVMTQEVYTVNEDDFLEEAAVLMREEKIGGLPVLSDGRLTGIITETDIFDAFVDTMGFRQDGTRLAIQGENRPGILADVTRLVQELGGNINSVAIFHTSRTEANLVIRFTAGVLETTQAIESLKKNGYKITSVMMKE